MAGKITANVLQLGDSATATQNFVLQTNVDGSAKLARGNAGATTQDILSIAANGLLTGAVNPTTGLRSTVLATMQKFADEFNNSLATNGWQKLPSGLIVQWGVVAISASSSSTFTYPVAFPTACVFAIAQEADYAGNSQLQVITQSKSTTSAVWKNTNGVAMNLNILVIGF